GTWRGVPVHFRTHDIFRTRIWTVLEPLRCYNCYNPYRARWGIRARKTKRQVVHLVRQVTPMGNSVGVAVPRELFNASGLGKGCVAAVRPIGMGLAPSSGPLAT
ncbi:MAG: hypothetical protein ACT4P5_00185, partial [Armatimonadota bacterium]